jgi:hypothetical protein
MANMASVGFVVTFKNCEQANAFAEKFNAHDFKTSGFPISPEPMPEWIFDAEIYECDGCRVGFYGEVRWGLEDTDMLGFLALYEGIVELEADCEEIGNCVLEKYTFKDGTLTRRYLKDDHPAWMEYHAEADNSIDDVRYVMEKEGIEEYIGTVKPQEVK